MGRFFDDFFGVQNMVAGASNVGTPWAIADTSSAGTPTYTGVTGMPNGGFKILLANTSEAENVCLYWNDILGFKWDNLQEIVWRIQASAITTAEQLTFGLWSARNDTVDSVAYNAHFTLHAATTVTCETDDAATDTDDKDSAITLPAATWKEFAINFRNGLSDVRFFGTNAAGKMERLCPKTTFNMSGASGTYCQPIVQLQKASGTTTPNVIADYVDIQFKRS
jgi:hypothetical protein